MPNYPYELLLESCRFTAANLDCGRTQDELEDALRAYGAPLLQLFEFDDDPGFFSPVIYQQDGRSEPGAFVALRDRIMFVWLKGRITLRPHTAVVPFADVVYLERGERLALEHDRLLQSLEIGADEVWTLLSPSAVTGRPHVLDRLAEWLGPALSPGAGRPGVSLAPRSR